MMRTKPTLARALLGVLALGFGGCTGVITLEDGNADGRAGSSGAAPGAAGSGVVAGAAGSAVSVGAGGVSATGGSSNQGGSGATPANGGASGGAPDCASPTALDPGPAPLRLLSREQYLNTLRDLIGDVPGVSEALGATRESSEFGLAQPDIGRVELENYQAAADLAASTVVNDAERLQRLAPCTGRDVRVCARDFVVAFGARAYRAPLFDEADIERHLSLFDLGAETSPEHGVELLLRAMLQSPRFLYRVEFGTGESVSAQAVKLSSHEVAARLSYALWNTLPDERLTTLATSGALATPDGVVEQAAWMLADARGQQLVRRFLERFVRVGELDWLVKDERFYPEWSDAALRRAMGQQAGHFFDHVLGSGGKLSSLLTSPTVFVNDKLGTFYGVTGGSDFAALERSDGTASGLLTLPALLARLSKPGESSPIHRGKFVREALLCQTLDPPPPNIPRAPEVDPNSSTRERLRQHELDPGCAGCHSLIDPIGFGFEHYDGIGRFRTTDGGQPVDARGELLDVAEPSGSFHGAVELGQMLAQNPAVEECMARQWFRFTLERFEQGADVCSMRALLDAFRASEASLTALPRALIRTDAFLYRRPTPQESP